MPDPVKFQKSVSESWERFTRMKSTELMRLKKWVNKM